MQSCGPREGCFYPFPPPSTLETFPWEVEGANQCPQRRWHPLSPVGLNHRISQALGQKQGWASTAVNNSQQCLLWEPNPKETQSLLFFSCFYFFWGFDIVQCRLNLVLKSGLSDSWQKRKDEVWREVEKWTRNDCFELYNIEVHACLRRCKQIRH